MSTSSPIVDHVETLSFRLPMRGVLRWGKSSALNEVRHVLVRVFLRDGSSGVAEAPPRPTIYGETVASIRAVIEEELAPRIVGTTVAAAAARLDEIPNNHTAKGALDMALHDALAQSRGETLAAHLGAPGALIPVSYILGIADLDTALAEASAVYAACVSSKSRWERDWAADAVRIAALRTTLGDDVALYADANECFTPDDAASRLAALREAGLRYCEEPLPVEEVHARAALRAAAVLPVIADDSCFTVRDLRRELALDTFDILNIKTARTGYTESTAMLDLARAAGKGVMVGSQASAGLGTVRAALFAAKDDVDHPSELSFFLKLREDVLEEPLTLHDGFLALEEAARARVDWARVARELRD
ncbi:MAG: enolase [Caldilineaceae bacterium]|nr:enolase [Caldilineaceae bacterium]